MKKQWKRFFRVPERNQTYKLPSLQQGVPVAQWLEHQFLPGPLKIFSVVPSPFAKKPLLHKKQGLVNSF